MTVRRGLVAILLLMFVGLQFRLWVGEGSFAHVSGLQSKVERAQTGNSVKEQRNKVLKEEIIDLKSGHESMEEKARSELGLIKEDETFFLLVDQENP
ncbi:MAG TPA: septum formation initiator family protein [Pseudomonadales bacterium]|jgi:cell division protein FtsB|nr:cell division protein FtsB [Gammaproteobacteria bacterium]MDP6026075.1 septum formation initiator family protein [Pseudomonadales bacterium]MDP6316947.1 septum formation initiator family protein [Pseudomonadales bacterium]HJP52593.1 septum formation initiator family protein [Pseudomonadales bacterium]|tara:strand:+ start:108 stop:398 length:291 start_codon:yes stop_codon:yes gene_type:complete